MSKCKIRVRLPGGKTGVSALGAVTGGMPGLVLPVHVMPKSTPTIRSICSSPIFISVFLFSFSLDRGGGDGTYDMFVNAICNDSDFPHD